MIKSKRIVIAAMAAVLALAGAACGSDDPVADEPAAEEEAADHGPGHSGGTCPGTLCDAVVLGRCS